MSQAGLSKYFSITSQPKSQAPSPSPSTSSSTAHDNEWNRITEIAANTNPNKHKSSKSKMRAIIQAFEYSPQTGVATCRCSAKLWTKKRAKACDLNDHLNVSAEHKRWANAQKYVRPMTAIKTVANMIKSQIKDVAAIPLNYAFLFATFVAMYFIITYSLSLNLLTAFNALFVFLGIKCSGTSYLSPAAINDMVSSFYFVRYNEVKSIIQMSNWYGIEFDESTSKVAPTSFLAITLSYRNRIDHTFETKHVKLSELESGDADAISSNIIHFIDKDLELKPYRFLSATGDNCSTNMGSKGGVMVKLQVVYAWLLILGCYAHKLALIITGCLIGLSHYKLLEMAIKRLITWARSGPKKAREISNAAKEIEEKAKKIGIIHKIRWLSKEKVMKSIYSSKISILTVLKREYENKQREALYLYPMLSTVHFWLYFCIILDILIVIGMLSRYFQSNWFFCGRTSKTIKECFDILSKKCNIEIRGNYVNDYIKRVKSGELEKFEMKSEDIDSDTISWMKCRYDEIMPLLKSKFDDRFKSKDLEFLDCFIIFDVNELKKKIKDNNVYLKYGHEQIKILCDTLSRKERKINYMQCIEEYDALKMDLKIECDTNPKVNNEDFWNDHMIKYDELDSEYEYYHVLLIYDAAHQIKINSAENERTFLAMNDIKTKKRGNLKGIKVDKLLFLAKSGWKDWKKIPFKKIISYFNKNRLTEKQKKRATFNQNVSFPTRKQIQYDDTKHLKEFEKKPKKKKQKKEEEEKKENADGDVSSDDDIIEIPIIINEDFIPQTFMDLLPKKGAVNKEECEDLSFFCNHSWDTVKSAVLECHTCGDLLCIGCLEKEFDARKCEINKYLQKKTIFHCPSCKIEQIKEKKDKSKPRRKRKKRT